MIIEWKLRFTRWARSLSTVTLLVLSASGVVLFTAIAVALVSISSRKLIGATELVKRSEDSLAALQKASQLVERIENETRLYRIASDPEQLNNARRSADQLDTSMLQLKLLALGDAGLAGDVQNLVSYASELHELVYGITLGSTLPEVQIQRCQQMISVVADREEWLLQVRDKESQRMSSLSVAAEVTFGVVSLLATVVLFVLLLRDFRLRRQIGRQGTLTNERLARSLQILEDRALESEFLNSARDEVSLCMDVEEVYRSAMNCFSRLLMGTSGSLCIINNSRQSVEVVSSWKGVLEGMGVKNSVEDFHSPESCCGLRSGQPRWRQPGASELHCSHFAGQGPDRYLCMPIVAHGNTMGMLYVECADELVMHWCKQHMDGLRQLVKLTGMAIATLNLRSRLENQSIKDSLTGIFNRHFMQISLDRELSRARRRKQVLAVFMLDLDHFKNFNDTYGHAAGDKALRAVSDIFKASVRTEDIACRYGGEEFTIIMPDVTPEVAYERAENIRLTVEKLRLPLDREIYGEMTVSIGVSLYPHEGDSADLLLRNADQALYRAKRGGRNRVALFGEMGALGAIPVASVAEFPVAQPWKHKSPLDANGARKSVDTFSA